MVEAAHQPVRLRIAFSLLSVFLLVAAATAWGAAALLPVGLLLAALGLVVLLTSRGAPPVTRWATFAIFGYVMLWMFSFVASTSITMKKGYWVNAYPPSWASPLQDLLVAGLPLVFLVGIGAALWPWSTRSGRGLLVGAGTLLLVSVVLGTMSAPTGTHGVDEHGQATVTVHTDTVDRAQGYAALSLGAFSLACIVEAGALGLLVARPPAPFAPG